MDVSKHYNFYLIREGAILVKTLEEENAEPSEISFELYDVRSGAHLKDIYPPFEVPELKRGFRLSEETAALILRNECLSPNKDHNCVAKVVTIVEARQRKLDAVVADSIIDQVNVIALLLQDFMSVAHKATREERFWLSQQVLTFVRKFSGRELAELQEILDWFKELHRRT